MSSASLSLSSGGSSGASSLVNLLSFGTPSGLPPSGTLLLHTTTPPTPQDLYASHLSARFLAHSSTARVIWLNCKAIPEAHLRGLVKRASPNARAVTRLQVIDAASFILTSSSASQAGTAAEAAAPLRNLISHIQACLSEGASASTSAGSAGEAGSLVVLDDLSSLVWTLMPPRTDPQVVKPRPVVLSHGKRRTQVVPVDAWAEELGRCVEELRRVCDDHNAALLTHLQAQSTCITSRAAPVARSQGAGQGFDADDAGEEDDSSSDEEVLPGTSEDTEILEQDEEGELIRNRAGNPAQQNGDADALALQRLDEFADGLFRACLAYADVWIEQRGLRSGQAADCHGEICIHQLARPSSASQTIIPRLPIPGTHDPFRTHRRAFKSAHPNFSAPPRATSTGSNARAVPLLGRALASASLRERETQTPAVFCVETCAAGRAKAMLFEVKELPARAEVRTWRSAAREA